MNELIAKYQYQLESIATYMNSRGVELNEETFKSVLKDWLHSQQEMHRKTDFKVLSSQLKQSI